MKTMDTRRLVALGLLVSMNVVLSRFASVRISIGGVEGIRIGLGNFPVVFAGAIFGAAGGGMVGAAGDIVGFMLNPMGAYMPHFTLSAALMGMIPGWVLSMLGRERITYLKLITSIGAGLIVTSVILNPLFLKLLFGIPLWTTVPPKVVSESITIPLYALFAERIGKKVAEPRAWITGC